MVNNFTAWQNGKFCQADDLTVKAQDLGLLRSYGVYDVITIKNNRVLALDNHLERFFNGCNYYYIRNPYSREQLTDVIKQLNTGEDAHIWIIATRGVPTTYNTADVIKATPQVMLMAVPYNPINNSNPLKLTISRKVRRIPDTSIDQRYKNFARQDFTIAQIEATMKGYDGPILLDNEDFLTEGPSFSIAVIKDGQVFAPAKNKLQGITMGLVRTLCREHNIPFDYCNITEEMMCEADDMFATTTAGGVVPVMAVDLKQFQSSELQQKIKYLYQQAWEQDQYSVGI